jgi:hypothetical protein
VKKHRKPRAKGWKSSEYVLSHVSPAQPGWVLVRIGFKNRMVLEPIAAFAFGTETSVWHGPRGRKRSLGTWPAVGVLAFAPGSINAGMNMEGQINWLGGDFAWLFDDMIAGVCAPGADPRPIFKEALNHYKKNGGV